jgi:hypothetical protein
MESQSESEFRPHSVVTDRRHWADNPDYFFASIPPRTSKYAVQADDASIQCQIDVFGKDHIGIIGGSLAPGGNFGALIYGESLPDRIAVLTYLTEMLSFYEGIVFSTLGRRTVISGQLLTDCSF